VEDSPLNDIRIGEVSHQWADSQKITSTYFKTTDSTNAQAKSQAFTEKAFTENLILYFADEQTGGRGRGGNTWSSGRPGSQLLSTWSFLIEEPPLPVASPMIGLALYRAALSTWPFLNWNLKAPNDLYIGEKKVAGLLIETLGQGDDHRLLIGLGLNVLSSPSDILMATALAKELGAGTPLLAQDWISFLERLIFEFSIAIQLSFEPLNTTSRAGLIAALNKHPHLKEAYVSIDEDANLKTAHRQISWQEL
jgi:BirA family biotin operon repressor/biotin-[acetyl-CoA-carboxylase] ligase